MLICMLVRLDWPAQIGRLQGMSDQVVRNSGFTGLASHFDGRIGGSILHFAEIGSTMDSASETIEASLDTKALHGKVIIADNQNRGRGRFGREWFSETGQDILMSTILCPRMAVTGQLTIMASLAVSMTVDEFTGETSAIKWPNDVRVGGSKICGVIAESSIIGDSFFGVLGIGLNVNTLPSADRQKDYSATSIREFVPSNKTVDRVDVLKTMLIYLNDFYDALERGETIVPEWRDKLETLGREIEVSMVTQSESCVGETIRGVAEDVDDFGRLLIREPGGAIRAVATGEVTVRKNPGEM